ncbi:MAG: GNAT family N-acetyltransferase [Sandaracinaceae bacterium]|nr:GNAT family N-acetyltransferase [Sandaracinaceae bacterium]
MRSSSSRRFRPATLADVPALHALVESAYRGEASRAGWTTEADFLDGQRTDPEELTELLSRADTRIVLAFDDDALVGCVLLRDEQACAYLGMLSVRPHLQSSGVGRSLLDEAERVARDELGRAEMRMRVISIRDSLIAWYERRGYARTDQTEPFPYGEPRAGRPRRDDLVFVVLRKSL